jgi:hypothetical protein
MNSGRFKKGHKPDNSRDWTEIDKIIKDKYPINGRLLAEELGISIAMLHNRASKLKIKCIKKQVLSEETRNKISKSNKNKIKDKQWRENLSKSLKGRNHSKERIESIISGMVNSRKTKPVMTKPEKFVLCIMEMIFGQYNPYKFTGNRKYFIKISDKKYRIPDFLFNEDKKIIEVFGTYWHRNDNEEDIINEYKNAGWDCLILWEHDLINSMDRILEFTFPYEFQHEINTLNNELKFI